MARIAAEDTPREKTFFVGGDLNRVQEDFRNYFNCAVQEMMRDGNVEKQFRISFMGSATDVTDFLFGILNLKMVIPPLPEERKKWLESAQIKPPVLPPKNANQKSSRRKRHG